MFTSSSKHRAAAEQSLHGTQSLKPSLSQVSVDRLKLSPRLGIGAVNTADDGDPLDIVVIHDATTFSVLVVTCRVIGILQIEQKSKKKSGRNDRLLPPRGALIRKQSLIDVANLTKPIREELEKFFIATDELEDKKLDIIGWKGPKAARQAVQDAAKSAAKWQVDSADLRVPLLRQ